MDNSSWILGAPLGAYNVTYHPCEFILNSISINLIRDRSVCLRVIEQPSMNQAIVIIWETWNPCPVELFNQLDSNPHSLGLSIDIVSDIFPADKIFNVW